MHRSLPTHEQVKPCEEPGRCIASMHQGIHLEGQGAKQPGCTWEIMNLHPTKGAGHDVGGGVES